MQQGQASRSRFLTPQVYTTTNASIFLFVLYIYIVYNYSGRVGRERQAKKYPEYRRADGPNWASFPYWDPSGATAGQQSTDWNLIQLGLCRAEWRFGPEKWGDKD